MSAHTGLRPTNLNELNPEMFSAHDRRDQVWGVANHSGNAINIETGIGFGVTSSSDRVTLKFMITRDLNGRSGA
jgi:hypothetical protein